MLLTHLHIFIPFLLQKKIMGIQIAVILEKDEEEIN
jgi:hypothetical protein